MSLTELVLLRHGESLWNAEHRYQGQQGTGLSALGRQQAKQAAEYLKALQIDEIVASDLQRVTETLQPYVDTLDQPSVRVDPRWREIDVGTWGGRTFVDVYADEPEVVNAFARGEDVARGGGETFRQLRARVWEAMNDIAGPARGAGVGSGSVRGADADAGVGAAGRPRRVLVVTHGGPIRVAAASALRLPAGAEMLLDPPVNCSLTTLRLDGLTSYNVPTGTDR
ncbi:histidine phosphatase family protein [Kribbella shirazensis]|uniref:Putative phosphoglycerate mutase n=1 Tax=Kribbella shirazensis TaxID=1105143 RepID=A0A7X5VID1_9ACTN|nr:histidine phosphatase family protein [Kribbella shirazensis]NIK61841.1 putative phosphoglycerate mutase [Kribbella shirazensis]